MGISATSIQQENDDVEQPRLGIDSLLHQGERQGRPEEGVGRRGESDKRSGLPLVDVELRQTQGREGGNEEGEVGNVLQLGNAAQRAAGVDVGRVDNLLQQREDHCGGGEAEGDVVGERVEFLADGRGDLEQAGGEAVEDVEDGAEHYEEECPQKFVLEGCKCGSATRKQVAAGDGVGDMFLEGHLFFHLGVSCRCLPSGGEAKERAAS